MIENITGQRLPARPGKSPEGWRQPNFTQLIFGFLPEFGGLIGQIELDFRHKGHRQEARMGCDEMVTVDHACA